jgi:quercetin dioxygenase-like cupin family protein
MPEIIRIGGVELRFLRSKEETGGSLDMFEMTLQPNARMPVPHHHESWDETVYGLAGTSTWRIGGREVEVAPGGTAFIGRGIVHGFENPGGGPATCLCVLTPGVLGPAYFREIAALVAGGPPDLARMREVMLRHGLVPAPSA